MSKYSHIVWYSELGLQAVSLGGGHTSVHNRHNKGLNEDGFLGCEEEEKNLEASWRQN